MFRLDLGSARRYCDGINRRSFLQLGVAGMAASACRELLRAKALSPTSSKNTSVILIWLDGGPGHMDMYDMKPDAPAEYRGIWQPIRTNVPGFDITELFPQQAQAHRQVLDRPLAAPRHRRPLRRRPPHAHDQGHGRERREQRAEVPRHRRDRHPRGRPAQRGHARLRRRAVRREHRPRPGYFGGHMLGAQHNPFETGGDPNAANFQVQNLNLAGGPDARPARRPPRAASSTSTTPARTWTTLPTSRRRWTASPRGVRVRHRPDGPRGVRHRARKTRSSATATAGPTGARARCWPAGWSRPARRSSPSTSAAGTITGT